MDWWVNLIYRADLGWLCDPITIVSKVDIPHLLIAETDFTGTGMYLGVPFWKYLSVRNNWHSIWTKVFRDMDVCDSLQHGICNLRAGFRDPMLLSVSCKEWAQSIWFHSYFWFRSIVLHCCFLNSFLFENNFKFMGYLQIIKIIQRTFF